MKHHWLNPNTGHNDRTDCGEREHAFNIFNVTEDWDRVDCPDCLERRPARANP